MIINPSRVSQKKFLIVSPPYRFSQASFPLGLMYVAAVLQKAGHAVEVIDLDATRTATDDYIAELKNRQYDYFLTGGMITAWNFIRFSAELVRKYHPEAKIVVGGGVVSSTPESLISVCDIDAGVIGEGETTILDLLNAYENNLDLSEVDGIVYKRDGNIIRTKPRSNSQDLDSIPFPAWDLFNVKDIYSRVPSHSSIFQARRSGTVYTTRGCPFLCSFCYTEKAVRQRSIANVIEEIRELKGRYGIRHISFADDLFVVRKKRAIEFAEALIKSKLNVTWSATGRCNIVEPEFCRAMKAAGCEFLGLGIESGSAEVLDAIKKKQSPKQIVDAVKMIQKAGIVPGGTFILGLPPETHKTVRETVDIYKQINTYRTHVNKFFFATAYPGTPLYDEMKSKGRIGDEIKYFEMISERGDAVDFVLNCTDEFSDEELITLKPQIEKEVFDDFIKKHPWHAFHQFFAEKTLWRKVQNVLLKFKMEGPVRGTAFFWNKILIILKIVPDSYVRQSWKQDKGYSQQQNMVDGRVTTF